MSGTSNPAPLRRLRGGIRLRSEEPGGWVARRWLSLLERRLGAPEREAGLEYARLGRIVRLTIEPGGVAAAVQGRAPQPYATHIGVPVLDEAAWRRVVDAMAAEAIYAAKLLSREVPPPVESLLRPLGLELLPPPERIALRCECPAAGACRHAAAVGYLVAQRLDEDPLLCFAMRGLPGDRLLERLAAARSRPLRAVAAAHAEPVAPADREPPEPESCLESFWRPGEELDALRRLPPPHHAPHALLRRLGPSPVPGRFPLVGLLASVYDAVSAAALATRDRAEGIAEPDEDGTTP